MPLNIAAVSLPAGGLLARPKHRPFLQVKVANFMDRWIAANRRLLFGGIRTARDSAEVNFCLLTGFVGRERAMKPNREPARAALGAVLDHVTFLAGGINPKAEAGEFIIP